MIRARVVVVVALLAGCRIADVDLTGKHCPCASGYTCNEATQLCEVGAAIDAPVDVGSDSATAQSCLTNLPQETLAFMDEFATFDAWTMSGGIWSASGGQAQQTDITATLAYAYPSAASGAATDYHVVTTMHQLDHAATNSAYEIAFRINTQTMDLYHCNFEPNDMTLVIQHTTGAQTPVLVTSTVAVDSDYSADMNITMEVRVAGTTATCCIREIAGASLTTSAIANANGPPGMKTYRMAAGYRGIQVFH